MHISSSTFKKLVATGISSTVLKWFQSFLIKKESETICENQTKKVYTSKCHTRCSIRIDLIATFFQDVHKWSPSSVNLYVDGSKISSPFPFPFPIWDKVRAKLALEEDLNNAKPRKDKIPSFRYPAVININTFCIDFTGNFLVKTLHSVSTARDLGVSLDS